MVWATRMHVACTPTNQQPGCAVAKERGEEHAYICGVRAAVGKYFWVSVFAFAEDAAWKTLAVLESGLLVWPYITSGEKGPG